METSKIQNDFLGFTRSKMGFRTSELARDMINGRGGFRGGYMNPYILEERELNVTQMDVFSRLMRDRIIFFGTEVTSETANIAVSQLLYLENVEPGAAIRMYVNSPGGGVYAGMGVIDTMDFISSPVGTTCTGLAASMGAMFLMCGEKGMRSALPHSRVMIHQPLGGIDQAQASDIEITAREILKLKDELYQIIVERSGKSIEDVRRDADRDYWMTAKEAMEYGLIDEVISNPEKKKEDKVEEKKTSKSKKEKKK